MNRLQKKCAIASAGVHLLLLVVLFVGPALMSPPPPKVPDMPILNFVPLETVDALVSGGGNPNARPPAAQPNVRPEPAAPVVEPTPPAPERKPEPRVQEPKARDPEPAPEPTRKPAPESKPKSREITLKPVIRRSDSGKSRAATQAQEREAREYAQSRQRLTQALASAANGISSTVSGSTTVELLGPGGGGVPYANFLQAVKSAYTRAWVLPDGVVDDNATVGVSVTIARNGSVIDAKIVRPSRNGAVNQSVRATLDAVKYAAPLPRTAKENQRTVTIDFNVRAKRLLG